MGPGPPLLPWSQALVSIQEGRAYEARLMCRIACDILVVAHGYDPCRYRYLLFSRAYKAQPLTKAGNRYWSGYRESNSMIDAGNVTRKPSRTSRIWWTVWDSNPTDQSCKDQLRSRARPIVFSAVTWPSDLPGARAGTSTGLSGSALCQTVQTPCRIAGVFPSD